MCSTCLSHIVNCSCPHIAPTYIIHSVWANFSNMYTHTHLEISHTFYTLTYMFPLSPIYSYTGTAQLGIELGCTYTRQTLKGKAHLYFPLLRRRRILLRCPALLYIVWLCRIMFTWPGLEPRSACAIISVRQIQSFSRATVLF